MLIVDATTTITTAEELLNAGDIGRCELVRGQLNSMTPASFDHGAITNELAFHLTRHVKEHQLGRIYAAETGFILTRNPDTVRAPDVAFVRSDRVPKTRTTGFFDGAPDLAVEILSPNDRAPAVLAKVQDWLGAGCQAVWVVDSSSQTISTYELNRSARILGADDNLTGGNIVPGFDLKVSEVFRP